MTNFAANRSTAREVLIAAFRRSFGISLPEQDAAGREYSISFLDLSAETRSSHAPIPGKKRKLLAFGVPGPETAQNILSRLGLKADATLPPVAGRDACPACAAEHHTESSAQLRYHEHPLTASLTPELRQRPFTRFDFADEWNNLGFGRIRTEADPWGARGGVRADGAVELAAIQLRNEAGDALYAGSYLTLLDAPDFSVLWCARPAGPADSVEWSVVERFVCDWRAGDLPCAPCLRQTPAGCRAVVTMRLDCDEDIASARDVFEWYAGEGVPFSLAVKTGLPMTPEDLSLLRDVHANGGALLSHSHTHALNWGASSVDVLAEAAASGQWFRDMLPEVPVPDLAVSPFHSNPPYAMRALEEAGFTGVVSGIIHNDPEYLLGRAGCVPFTSGRLLSISQQSMLHGDCYRRQGESVAVHVRAFAAQHAAHGIFGYLDHPFSARYQYGWESKAQRLEAHQKLIAALRAYEDVWFWNQRQCFDFVRLLSRVRLSVDMKDGIRVDGLDDRAPFRPVCRWRGEEYSL